MPLELIEIKSRIQELLKTQMPPLRIRTDNDKTFEVCGSIQAMQGRRKVDGYYFASVMEKPKDIRFYFFPIYTHADHFTEVSPELLKALKGKSCFHLKNVSEEMMEEIKDMIEKGVLLYESDGLI